MSQLITLKDKKHKRIGRGISAGGGKTAGRGTKGQKARAGYDLPNRFEGGQTPLSLRLPKLPGFKSHRAKPEIITLDQLSAKFKSGDEINLAKLIEASLVKAGQSAKILNNGQTKNKYKIGSDVKVSKQAKAAIE